MATDRPSQGRGDDTQPAELLRRGLKAAVARWVLQRRVRHADGTGPPPRDEATHPWDGRRHFAEDYTFAGVQAGLGVLVRLEWLPGRDAHRVWVVAFTDEGAFAIPGMTSGGTRGLIRVMSSDRWRAGGLELDCETPHRQWTVRYTGRVQPVLPRDDELHASPLDEAGERRCSVDLTFVADGAPYVPGTDDDPELVARSFGEASWDVRLARRLRRHLSRAYVQLGKLHGTVVVGDRMLAVRADCIRSHTWGVRDWAASDDAYQCLLTPGGDERVWVHSARFPWLSLEGGFLRRGEALSRVRSLGLTREEQPGSSPTRATLSIEHGQGHLGIESERLSEVALEIDGRGCLELAFMRTQVPGRQESGYGLWAWQRRLLPRPMG